MKNQKGASLDANHEDSPLLLPPNFKNERENSQKDNENVIQAVGKSSLVDSPASARPDEAVSPWLKIHNQVRV